MKELEKWQLISFLSRISAMAIGLVQTFVIIRLLSVEEWGIVQLAVSIGSALGVYQHLGLAAASTREIAGAKKDSDIFKIFLTSVVIRYAVVLPLAVGLFFYADTVASKLYNNPQLVFPLKVYALSFLAIGAQSILNAVISGTKRFKRLFIYQVAASSLSVVVFIPSVMLYRIDGYFLAFLLFNILNTLILVFLAFKPLKGKLAFPALTDFKDLFKKIFTVSMAVYAVKILATNWERLGPNLLGISNSPQTVAVFAIALLYSKKILSISDSVTDVNLPVLSQKYANDLIDFKHVFEKNFNKVFGLIALSSAVACYWAPQVIKLLVGGDKYDQSYQYIPLILLAFVVYSIVDLIKSSIFVPAKLVKEMVSSYVILVLVTVAVFFIAKVQSGQPYAMTLALSIGATTTLVYIIFSIKSALGFWFFTYKHWLVLIESFLVGWVGIQMSLTLKFLLFPVLAILLVSVVGLAGLINGVKFLKYGKKAAN